MPEPPATSTTGPSPARRWKAPYGPVKPSSSPERERRRRRAGRRSAAGIALDDQLDAPSPGRLAIENDRARRRRPAPRRSTYWPGRNAKSSGSSTSSSSRRMSCVSAWSASDARASVAGRVLEPEVVGVEVQQLDRRGPASGIARHSRRVARWPPRCRTGRRSSTAAARPRPRAGSTCTPSTAPRGSRSTRLKPWRKAASRTVSSSPQSIVLADRLEMDRGLMPWRSSRPAGHASLPFCWPPRFIRPLCR